MVDSSSGDRLGGEKDGGHPRTPALTGCAFFGGLALVISSRLHKFYAIIGFELVAIVAL